MKPYFVYAGDNYYPRRAMCDFKKSFETLEEANDYSQELENNSFINGYEWFIVVDIRQYM